MKFLVISDPRFEDDHLASYRQKLCDELVVAGHSVSVLLKLPTYFLKALSLARSADAIFVPNFPSIAMTALTIAKLFKKKLFVKVVGDYAWESAIGRGDTFFLINDFQKTKRSGWSGVMHGRQVKLCRTAENVLVESDFLANIIRGWGIDGGKIRVVSGGIDFMKSELSKEEARKQIGIPGNIILSAGQLVPWRGFRMLIKIMPQLLAINQFFRLVIVGSGSEHGKLQPIIKNLGLDKKVFLVGNKNEEESAWFRAAADLFVLNTSYEGFPYCTLEAMFDGIPVITTAACANPELIKQGENGFMVKYNDEFNLVEAIKTIWQTPELRERFVEKGRETAEQFSIEKTIKETVKTLTGNIEK